MPRHRHEEDFEDLFGPEAQKHVRFTAIDWDEGQSFRMRIEGGKEALNLIFQQMKQEDRGNTLIYPLVWNARHLVELMLKEALWRGRKLDYYTGIDPETLFNTHNLEQLGNHVRALLDEADIDLDGWPDVRTFLRTWDRADPDGAFFEYGRDTTGDPIPVVGNGNVGATKVIEGVDSTIAVLQKLLDYLDAHLDMKAEYEAEMRQYADFGP